MIKKIKQELKSYLKDKQLVLYYTSHGTSVCIAPNPLPGDSFRIEILIQEGYRKSGPKQYWKNGNIANIQAPYSVYHGVKGTLPIIVDSPNIQGITHEKAIELLEKMLSKE